ncbi:MAG: pre-peptidase C-terminal domain-containing protein [Lyngbya sp.]|nr:pre-peptidase C-terminal domain-containing protein [Lyngbya sp.]
MVQVGFSTSTTFEGNLNALIEDQDTSLTVNFELDEPAPEGGLKVFVDSNIEQIVNRLDLPGFAFNPIAENINPSLLGTSFDNSGFYLTIDEGATSGSFTINVFDNEEPDTFLPETFDGLVETVFELKTQDEVEDEDLGDVGTLGEYTINPDAATSTVLFADDESQLPQGTGYDEAVSGDISGDPNNPLELPLTEGTTTLSATTEGGDQEYVTVTVPDGFQLDSLILESFSTPGDPGFIGVQSGTTFTEPLDISADVGNFLGYLTFGSEVGTDILDNMGSASGAIGFEGPLPSGDYTFALQQLTPSGSDYTLAFNVSEAEIEPPPPSGLPLVSLNTGPDYLVEEEGTVSAHVFNITGGTIPSEGLVVSVSAPNLSEFDLEAINVSEGGEIVAVREDGFDIRLTDFTVLIDLPIAADGEAEGLETASFSLVSGEGYEVNSDFSSGEFTLVDTTDEIPANSFTQLNDILPLAVPIELSEDNPTITITDAIDFDIGNRYLNDDGTYTYVDVNEDVDFYSFNLSAGDIISFDLDSNSQRGEPPATIPEYQPNYGLGPFGGMRLFDAEGNEVEADWQTQGPGELFTAYDGYLEFVAPENGTYYLAVSGALPGAPGRSVEILGTDQFRYDPFVPGSGNDESYPDSDEPNFGEYDLIVNLNPEVILELPQFSGDAGSSIINDDGSNSSGDVPTVSLDFMTATFDPNSNDDLLSPYIVEELPDGGGILVLNFKTEGEIPSEGILVNVSSDNYLRQYVSLTSLWFPPFNPGAEMETLLYDETGRETGFQLRIFEPTTYTALLAGNEYWGDVIEPDVDEPEEVTWFLEPGSGYAINSDASEIVATYYDSLEDLPEPSVIPEVGLTISEPMLIESEQTVTTLTFTLSEPPPEEGVIVQVNGSSGGLLPQFDIFNLEIDGGILPYPNFDFSGFYFKITEQEASLTLPVFEDPFDEGLQSYSFSLAEAPNYTIDSNASVAAFTIADTPDSVLEVSLSSESETLVESENPTAILTFNLTANPPTEGVMVSVDAPNLSEFDVEALTVTGGEISEITDSGFSLNITDATATVELPADADGVIEGLETATFTLAESGGSTINPEANEATIALYDNPNQIPVTSEIDANDTIAEADDLNLNPENNYSATVRGILSDTEPGQDFTELNNLSEDVDIYKFDLEAGNTLTVDVDAVGQFNLSLYEGVDLRLDSELRLFDADGNELASVNNAAAPDEEFSRDPYLEFTAEEAGTYYVGVSQLGNNNYDPFVEGSGSGWIFPEIGVYVGEYDLNVSLNSANVPDLLGTDGDDELVGTDTSESIDALAGDDIAAGGLGDDTVFGGDGDDTLRGDANSRSPGGTVGGDDVISGGAGDDQIGGKAGNDLLSGDAGDDEIWGDDGDDTIMGVTGNDTLTGDDFSGGSGSDLFVFGNGDGTDLITDFDITEDMIGLVEGELTFDQIAIASSDMGAMISVIESGETLAVLQGVGSDELTEELFMVTPDVTFG